ncbi:MAG TPA: hypothetical protein PKA00_22220 [Saprospiraceae bacterium]|nr:hypothetical protein [Saprospiraceae bacterium]HMQ85645.1 hypothetical protein [Saprospiraceae bacterium]
MKLLILDYVLQTILGILLLVFGIFILPLILLMPLGGVQMLSALVKGIAWKSRFHLTWFMAGAAYCLALYTFAQSDQVLDPIRELHPAFDHFFWILFFYILVPATAAFVYWRLTQKEYLSNCVVEEEFVA